MAIVFKNEADLVSVRTIILPDQFNVLVCMNQGSPINLENGGEDDVLQGAETIHSGGEDDVLVADNILQNTT